MANANVVAAAAEAADAAARTTAVVAAAPSSPSPPPPQPSPFASPSPVGDSAPHTLQRNRPCETRDEDAACAAGCVTTRGDAICRATAKLKKNTAHPTYAG